MTGPEAPSGDVTFVFTDIEGSTQLMRELGDDAYRVVLHEHRDVLRRVWSSFGGYEVDTEGDSFLVAFGDPIAAVMACLAAHDGMAASTQLRAVGLRVRAGAHRGAAYPADGEYVSVAVARAARIVAGASGGQTLLSAAAASSCQGGSGFSVEPLGRFRVRDFGEPAAVHRGVEVFEATKVGLPAGPEPRFDRAIAHNLPAGYGDLIGRAQELRTLSTLLESEQIVTLVGPGGVGKTRLAVQAALDAFEHRQLEAVFVDLSVVSDGTHLGGAVAEALGVSADSGSAWDDAISDLRPREALLVLDNCEHLFPDSSLFAAEVAAQCPNVTVVATSRERLGVSGERTQTLSPLPTRGSAGDAPDLASQMFCACLSVPLDPADAQAVAEICELLDGLPLAIEIAAAQVDPIPVHDVLDALRESPAHMVAHGPGSPERHRSIDAVLEWSVGLLSDDEAGLLHRIAVLAGGFTLDAARVAGADGQQASEGVRGHLWSLASKSLLQVNRTDTDTRYRMLGTVRDYVLRRADEADCRAARERIGAWLVERIGPQSHLDVAGLAEVGSELDTIRGLIHDRPGLADRDRQRLAWSIGRYYDVTDRFRLGANEVQGYSEELPAPGPPRVALLTMEADLRMRFGDVDRARILVEEAEALAAEVGLPAWDDGGLARAQGGLALADGDHSAARAIAEAGLDRDLSLRGEARLLDLLGVAEGQAGNFQAAADALERELVLWDQQGLDSYAATTLGNLAEAYLGLQREVDAASHQLRCLGLAVQLDQPVLVAFSLVVAAHLAAADARWLDAAALQGAADAALLDVEYVLYPADVDARTELVARVSAHGRAERVSALLSDEGRTPLGAAIEIARDVLGSVANGE